MIRAQPRIPQRSFCSAITTALWFEMIALKERRELFSSFGELSPSIKRFPRSTARFRERSTVWGGFPNPPGYAKEGTSGLGNPLHRYQETRDIRDGFGLSIVTTRSTGLTRRFRRSYDEARFLLIETNQGDNSWPGVGWRCHCALLLAGSLAGCAGSSRPRRRAIALGGVVASQQARRPGRLRRQRIAGGRLATGARFKGWWSRIRCAWAS